MDDGRKRVIQLLATGTVGGAQESATALMLHLDRSRFDVEAWALADGAAVRRLHDLGYPVTVLGAGDDVATVRELSGLLRRRRVDLLHAHMFRAELLGTRAARAARTPTVVATVHSSRVRSAEDIAALAVVTPSMDRLIAPSASIAAKVHREGRGAAEITVVPNGVDADRFRAHLTDAERAATRAALGIPAEAFLVGVVARLEPEKGHHYLLEAWPMVARARPDAWLLIVGEGSEADALRAQADAMPAGIRDRVVLVGRPADVAAVTAALDVAVMPSLREAQGIAILEALAAQRAVVASRVGGIPETIRHGVHGLLVPPANPPALARALLRLAADPRLRARLGAAGARRVDETFSVTAAVRRTEAIYLEELSRRRASRARRSSSRQPV